MNLSTQWLPKLPTGWQIANPKSLFSERTQKCTVSDIHLTPSQKLGILPQSEYMELTGGSVVLNLTGSDNMKHVEKNDFIIHLRSFQGGIEHSNYSGKVSNAYCVLRPTQQIEPRYFRWVLKSQGYIQELNATTDQLRDGQSIKFEQFASIGLPLPPIEEQRRIADYLDRQLEVIDRLIIKKQDQIRNLREYFESSMLIEIFGENTKEIRNIRTSPSYNNSYLRHLDPKTKISPFKDIFRFKKVQNQDPDPKILSLTKHGIVERDITNNEGQIAYSYDNYAVATIGDFVLNPMDLRAGSVAISNLTGVVSNAYFVFEIRKMHKNTFDSKYCEYMLRSNYLKDIFYCHGTGLGRPEEGGGGRWTLSKETLSNFPFPIPSYDKQISIRKELTSLEENYRTSIANIELMILKLKDLKISLITESVLGGSELK